jgi:hypothetical protein
MSLSYEALIISGAYSLAKKRFSPKPVERNARGGDAKNHVLK